MLARQVLAAAALAASAIAQTTTLDAFLGPDLTASVVVAGCESTVYAIGCDSSDNYYCAQVANYGPSTLTLTAGSTANEIGFTTQMAGGIASMSVSCDYYGPSPSFTSEECYMTVSVSISGQVTSTSTTVGVVTLITPNPLVITAGVDKLTNSACPGVAASTTASETSSATTTASATSSTNSIVSTSHTSASQGVTAAATTATTSPVSSATSGSTGAAAAVVTAVPVYKVLLPVGAAIAAGAVFL